MLVGRVLSSLRVTLWLLSIYGGAFLGSAFSFVYFRLWYIPPPVHRFPVELRMDEVVAGKQVLVGEAELRTCCLEGQPLYLSMQKHQNQHQHSPLTIRDSTESGNSNLTKLARLYQEQGRPALKPLLLKGQSYDLLLHLQVAEVPSVLDRISPLTFEVCLEGDSVDAVDSAKAKTTHKKPPTSNIQPHYPFTRLRAIPHKNHRLRRAQEWLNIPFSLITGSPTYSWYQFNLLSNFIDDSPEPVTRVTVKISCADRHVTLPVNGAVFEVTAHFRGIKYLVHHWPIASAFVMIGGATLLSWLLITVYLITTKTASRRREQAAYKEAQEVESDHEEAPREEEVILPAREDVQEFVGHLRHRQLHQRTARKEYDDEIVIEQDLAELTALPEEHDSGDQSVPSSHGEE